MTITITRKGIIGFAKWLWWTVAGTCVAIVLIGAGTGRLHIDGVSYTGENNPQASWNTPAPVPTCTPDPDEFFNSCVALDPTQVEDERPAGSSSGQVEM